ncbi:hypothetical protein GQ55_9G636900 [Panicum hallii var. hallii]|uniref:L-ascorbate peroxidase n=1 Tax=Panicum hallii var. hallii TaxID=1504633 RepID=A0A2T7CIR5_9POAL|nr:hypothetical protein GQ55_9G636900 [Panicum hallii var. hallii]
MGWWITLAVVYLMATLLAMCAGGNGAALQPSFYGATCPPAEMIVRQEVIRGTTLLESTPDNTAERDSPVNNAKARLEDACPGVVSCADILAFAARDNVELSGGPRYDVPGGRPDGTVSMASEVPDNIPAPTFNLDQLTQSFAAKGLTQEDMVTLSGAHTIGRAHCTAFSDRLYNFSATGAADPALDPPFLAQLQHACPATGPGGGVDPGLVVPMEPRTPYALDTLYYWGVLAGPRPLRLRPGAAGQRAHRRAGQAERVRELPVEAEVRRSHGQDGADPGAHRQQRPDQGQVQRRQLKHLLHRFFVVLCCSAASGRGNK